MLRDFGQWTDGLSLLLTQLSNATLLNTSPMLSENFVLSRAFRVLVIALVALMATAISTATGASLVFQKTPGSSGNLFAMDEFGEPWEVERSGENPSLDRWGRLILYYQEGDIKITDIQGQHVEIVNEMSPEPTMPVHPQWFPGGGIIFDGDGDIHLEIFGPFGRVVYTPVSWGGNQSSPVVFADGKKIAFLSDTKPTGEKLSGTGPAVYVADIPSSEGNPVENPVQVTNPASVTAVSGPSFSRRDQGRHRGINVRQQIQKHRHRHSGHGHGQTHPDDLDGRERRRPILVSGRSDRLCAPQQKRQRSRADDDRRRW